VVFLKECRENKEERFLNRMMHQFRNNIKFDDELNRCRETSGDQAIMRMIREPQLSVFNIDWCVQSSSSLFQKTLNLSMTLCEIAAVGNVGI
jgi:hypothetical protein